MGLNHIEVLVRDDDELMLKLLADAGFMPEGSSDEIGGVTWMPATARPMIPALPEGYRLVDRNTSPERRHWLESRNGPDIEDRLQQLGFRGALIGPEGSGKTTLLEELHAKSGELGLRGRLVRAGRGRLRDIPPARLTRRDFLFVDSVERLSWFEWRRLKWASRGAGGLVMTSHRAGLLPTLWECRTTPELLGEILRELLASEFVDPENLSKLFNLHSGNIRAALRQLYDRASESAAPCTGCGR